MDFMGCDYSWGTRSTPNAELRKHMNKNNKQANILAQKKGGWGREEREKGGANREEREKGEGGRGGGDWDRAERESHSTLVLATTLRQKLQIKLGNSPSHSILTMGPPVPALTL